MIERRRRERAARSSSFYQFVTFGVGDEEYAIDIACLREIVQPVGVTRVPRVPDFIEGIIELRGALLPVVDLRRRFGSAVSPLSRSAKYLVVAMEIRGIKMIVGLIVERVGDPMYVGAAEVRPAPAPRGERAFFSGVVHRDARILMVVDVEGVLSSAEKDQLADMGRA